MLFYAAVCVALLPVLLLRDFTPANELRYLSIADEALRNHTFFAFTNHGVPYADKPPLYLWIVMLCRRLTGEHHLWLLSLFSLLPALGIILAMDRWVGRRNFIAGLMLITSGYFLGAAVV
ncbi:MAG: dolichyl-phosphate-mannose--protein mannosyltransferase, partial [Bacteroidales bacterium]|nr:dolichyl-phosphate-mannose--protein mannosyltransferase [Bacteroidales bacterium]